jgi:hypothetical protein
LLDQVAGRTSLYDENHQQDHCRPEADRAHCQNGRQENHHGGIINGRGFLPGLPILREAAEKIAFRHDADQVSLRIGLIRQIFSSAPAGSIPA